MIVRDIHTLADLHTGLRLVAASRHRDAKWASARLEALCNGAPLDDSEAPRIRAAESEAFHASDARAGARQTIQLEPDDPPMRRVRVATGKDVIA